MPEQMLDSDFRNVAHESVNFIGAMLRDEFPSDDSIRRARIASSLLSAWTRHEQTKSARETTTFIMARELAADTEQLHRYIEVTMPHHGIIQALKAG